MFTTQTVMTLGQGAVQTMLMVAGPLLLIGLAVGLLISIIQAATQINESTLSFIPKLLATIAALAVLGPWMLQLLMDYTRRLLESIPGTIG